MLMPDVLLSEGKSKTTWYDINTYQVVLFMVTKIGVRRTERNYIHIQDIGDALSLPYSFASSFTSSPSAGNSAKYFIS